MEVSVDEAAALLGVSPRRVRALIENGRLKARRIGRSWLVDADGLHGLRRTRRALSSAMATALMNVLSQLDPDDWAVADQTRVNDVHNLSLDPRYGRDDVRWSAPAAAPAKGTAPTSVDSSGVVIKPR